MKFKFVESGRWRAQMPMGYFLARKVSRGWRVELIMGVTASHRRHIGWFDSLNDCRVWLGKFSGIYNRSPWVTVGEALDEVANTVENFSKAESIADESTEDSGLEAVTVSSEVDYPALTTETDELTLEHSFECEDTVICSWCRSGIVDIEDVWRGTDCLWYTGTCRQCDWEQTDCWPDHEPPSQGEQWLSRGLQ